jgi:hypothetical protein
MKKSEKNLSVIQNFILHLTHSSKIEDMPVGELDVLHNEVMEFTPELLYKVAKEYIKEDHVDGEDMENDEIIIPKYSAESSFVFEDKEKLYPENIVVISDLGETIGTESIATFPIDVKDELDNLLNIINEQVKY